MTHKKLFLFLLIIISLSSCSVVDKKTNNDSDGKIAIVTGIGMTQETALNNAFREAIIQTMGIEVYTENMIKNSQLVKNRLLSVSAGSMSLT